LAIWGAKLSEIVTFFDLIMGGSADNLKSDEIKYLSEGLKKCFPHNSSITFDTSEPDERWN